MEDPFLFLSSSNSHDILGYFLLNLLILQETVYKSKFAMNICMYKIKKMKVLTYLNEVS